MIYLYSLHWQNRKMARITHRHIEIFHAVMTSGNLTAAAEMLHSSQATLSRELVRLE